VFIPPEMPPFDDAARRRLLLAGLADASASQIMILFFGVLHGLLAKLGDAWGAGEMRAETPAAMEKLEAALRAGDAQRARRAMVQIMGCAQRL
jgi:DNA-binding FadR family transcriptional regulator